MIAKLPPWVEIGGFWLAAMAGAVNAIGLLGFEHQAVSHLTGTSTLLGLSLVNFDMPMSVHLSLILIAFVFGAALSGVIIDGTALRLGRGYGIALILEAVLLIVAMVALRRGSSVGHFLASAACGLQNGMVSTFSGATVRTTHVSGLFTDLGTMLGGRLRGRPFDRRKATLFLVLITGFILGGSVGAWGFSAFGFESLLIPSAAALALAIVHSVYWYSTKSKGSPGHTAIRSHDATPLGGRAISAGP